MSSLRSHFERIAHHDHSSQGARRPQPRHPQIQVEPLDRGTLPNERLSLNSLTTRPSSDQSNLLDSCESRQDTSDSTRLPVRPLTAEIPRISRPVSSHMLVLPRYKPPLVTVLSPIPPERDNGASKSIPPTSEQRDNAAMIVGHRHPIASSDTAVAPVPNRVTKPVLHSHSGFRHGYHTDASGSKTSSGSG